MVWYLLTFSDHKKALEYAWGIMVSNTTIFPTFAAVNEDPL